MRFVDLSLPIRNQSMDTQPQEIRYIDHYENARRVCKFRGINPDDLPEPGLQSSFEILTLSSHAGTHVDAPSHYGPLVEGVPGRTIDQVPLEWCFSDGVVLDFTHKKRGELIMPDDLTKGLGRIGYALKPLDIVLIRTDAYKQFDHIDFADVHPGMSAEATLWLIDRGIRMMGIDAYGFDAPHSVMTEAIRRGDKERYFPAHRAGRRREYCHIEKMANFDKLPRPFGFKLAVFPVLIERGSGGWCRAVAILEE